MRKTFSFCDGGLQISKEGQSAPPVHSRVWRARLRSPGSRSAGRANCETSIWAACTLTLDAHIRL
eukprot:3320522-Pleurochrysis_carterae.AAC.1